MFEADHDEAAFEKRLKKIAKPKPQGPALIVEEKKALNARQG